MPNCQIEILRAKCAAAIFSSRLLRVLEKSHFIIRAWPEAYYLKFEIEGLKKKSFVEKTTKFDCTSFIFYN